MQFLATLFGGNESSLLNAAFALGLVLVLLLLVLWGIKLVLSVSSGLPASRGRRLVVVESLQLDARHRVVIIRRDNVEHVVLTGGSQDIVLESALPVERPTVRRPRATPASQPMPRRPVANPPASAPESQAQPAPTGSDAHSAPAATLTPTHEPFMPRRSVPPLASLAAGAKTISRPLVIPTTVQDQGVGADDSATSEDDQHGGQGKLGTSSSRFPGSTFKYEGH